MQIGVLSDSLSSLGGGVFEIELALAQELRLRSNEVSAFGIIDDAWNKDQSRWLPIKANAFKSTRMLGYNWSPKLRNTVINSGVDILHVHGLWTIASSVALAYHYKNRKPYIVTPHGMLEPWALRNSGWKKRLALCAFDRRLLKHADCIHANTNKELCDIRELGFKNPIAVIPNGIHPDSIKRRAFRERPNKTLLYIGRIHPKKGLSTLLRAWNAACKSLRHSGWSLSIAGWDQHNHLAELESYLKSSSLRWKHITPLQQSIPGDTDVNLYGPVFGKSKEDMLENASAFVLPSKSEGLPMAVLEAWASNLPVLMTNACNLPEGTRFSASLTTEATESALCEALLQLAAMNSHALFEMGTRGLDLVDQHFSWPKLAEQLETLFSWIVNGTRRPNFVDI